MGTVIVHTGRSKPRAYSIQYFVPIQISGMTKTEFLILVVCFSFFFCFSKGATPLTQYTSQQTSKLHTTQHRRPRSLQGVWILWEDVTVELKDWLPAALSDLDEAYKDDIVCRDATPATDPPGRTLARLPWESLLRSQSADRVQGRTLTASPLETGLPHVQRVRLVLRGGSYCAVVFDPWS